MASPGPELTKFYSVGSRLERSSRIATSDERHNPRSHSLKLPYDVGGGFYCFLDLEEDVRPQPIYLDCREFSLPLHQVKIDRSFVRDMLADGGSRVIAHAIISLSLALGLSVISEGVETEEQRESLSRMGCHSLQGYLISPALPLDEFELWQAGIAKHAA
jgi:hypothetical protein